ncbi:MAG: potassium channel family protein [Halobacteriales archaeon]|nr:potassium channel family protein [Halobacteriales archaeon]
MNRCGFVPTGETDEYGRCPRPTHADADYCVFHLSATERRRLDIPTDALQEAFRSDVEAPDDRRRQYVGIQLDGFDLSALVIDGQDVSRIEFHDLTVEGTVDLTGSIVRHPVVFTNCQINRIDTTDATFVDDVRIEASRVGDRNTGGTALRCRRAAFEGSLHISETRIDGGVEFAATRIDDWVELDGCTVSGRIHCSNASFRMAQFINTDCEDETEFTGMAAEHVTFEQVTFDEGADFAETTIGTLRFRPIGDVRCRFLNATINGGRLDQPQDGTALYDLTDATIGEVALDCSVETFDRYRFYRTQYDGFPFATYRRFLRANRWRLHEYAGNHEHSTPIDTDGLELTYLHAKQGASAVGDNENASAFFIRELRYRRQRYAAVALDPGHDLSHRINAGLRWFTNGFLDLIAGYGERPQRVVGIAFAVILSCAVVYPATAGLDTGTQTLTYANNGPTAVTDGLYFSVVTFATLGLGDVHPMGDVGRLLAASEALVGAFLTALFVFSLGRRVIR